MMRLNKTCYIAAPAAEVFEALTNPIIIENWSGQAAEFQNKLGGKFELWDGSVHGINVEIVEPTRLVQDWKEVQWKEYSRVTFTITPGPDETTLEVVHENIPNTSFPTIDRGWDEFYLGKLQRYLEDNFLG